MRNVGNRRLCHYRRSPHCWRCRERLRRYRVLDYGMLLILL